MVKANSEDFQEFIRIHTGSRRHYYCGNASWLNFKKLSICQARPWKIFKVFVKKKVFGVNSSNNYANNK